jgi:hypothetical protein
MLRKLKKIINNYHLRKVSDLQNGAELVNLTLEKMLFVTG